MRLLVRRTPSESERSIELAGERWAVEEWSDEMLESSRIPEYTAVSYAWGPGRVAHPYEHAYPVSDRALEVLEVVARVRAPNAIWLDAFCVPARGPARDETLRRLGAIYALAREVIVVLSENCLPLFQGYAQGARIGPEIVQRLEDEPWVQRFWTYQELARSQRLHFVAQRGSNASIDGSSLLDQLGAALYEQQKSAASATSFPAADSLCDALASWLHGGSEPFAYQVMAGLAKRLGEQAADRFNAAFGAVAPDLAPETTPDLPAASERFMRACEAKGDFSFIYSRAPRSPEPGKSWRPLPGDLPPILPWHTFGKGQQGTLERTHVRLQDLMLASPGPLQSSARVWIEEYLARCHAEASEHELAARVFAQLKTMGFERSRQSLELAEGLLFLGDTPAYLAAGLVLIAAEVRWSCGAAALLVEPCAERRHRVHAVGVFVGPISAHGGAAFDIE